MDTHESYVASYHLILILNTIYISIKYMFYLMYLISGTEWIISLVVKRRIKEDRYEIRVISRHVSAAGCRTKFDSPSQYSLIQL